MILKYHIYCDKCGDKYSHTLIESKDINGMLDTLVRTINEYVSRKHRTHYWYFREIRIEEDLGNEKN